MNRIEIKGFKSIKELNLELRPLNIFIGANGSGKSNFLSFFNLLRQIYNQNLQEYTALNGVDSFLHNGPKYTDEISAHLHFNGTNGYSFILKKGVSGFIFTSEAMWYDKNRYEKNPVEIATLGNESNLRLQTKPRAEYILSYLNQLTKYHFHDTSEHSPFKQSSNVENDRFFLYEDGRNLAAFLYNIGEQNHKVYNLIVKTIQSIAPYFLDFFLRPEANGNIKLRWFTKHSSTIYGANDLSDGTLRFIALVVLFMQPELPQTIIIDEPELGLHPAAIAKLAGLIKAAASANCQIIVATQSTDLISHFEPEDIVTVDLRNGQSIFERLDTIKLQHWLNNYTIDDLWKRNIIETGHPNFDFV
jgi:predicted ATPase